MPNKHNDTQRTRQTGLVISYFGNSVAVEAADGQVFQCYLRRNQNLPVVGDRVLWEAEKEEGGRITAIEPRRSLLARGDDRGKMKPLAANIDHLIVVMSPAPVFSDYLIDRYMVAAELLSIRPVLLLNKADLLDEAGWAEAERALQVYRDIPCPVFMTSAVTGDGLQALSDYLKNTFSVLLGPSGVGKSSIISALTQEKIRTTEVSSKGAGKHTTTATRFYHLPGGGGLIDSPGVRNFNLWPVSNAEILQGFREFAPYTSGCKFRDCQHLVEPGCKLIEAAAENKISSQRFNNYKALIDNAKAQN